MLRLNLASKCSFPLLVGLVLCAACSGTSSPAAATPPRATPASGSAVSRATGSGPAGPPATTAASTPRPAGTPLSSLSLVYVDRSKGGAQAGLYTAAYDGGEPKQVATLAQGQRPIDVRGKTLAALDDHGVTFFDLTGAAAPVSVPIPVAGTGQPPTSFPSDGRFVDDRTFVFTTATGCGNGPLGSALFAVDTAKLSAAAGAVTKVATIASPNATIVGSDAGSHVVAVSPRGCDVMFHAVDLYSLTDGKLLSSTQTLGCGWAVASPALKKALVGWRSCNQPGSAQAGLELSLYDLNGSQAPGRDLRGPNGETITQPAVLRPGQPEAAFATSAPGARPGAAAGKGLWLVNLNGGAFKQLSPGSGAEQAPIGWSPEGRDLLVQTTVAQGVCSYSSIDVVSLEVHPLSKDLTFCGANGDVLGWTRLG